jgi:hypothetical protein
MINCGVCFSRLKTGMIKLTEFSESYKEDEKYEILVSCPGGFRPPGAPVGQSYVNGIF